MTNTIECSLIGVVCLFIYLPSLSSSCLLLLSPLCVPYSPCYSNSHTLLLSVSPSSSHYSFAPSPFSPCSYASSFLFPLLLPSSCCFLTSCSSPLHWLISSFSASCFASLLLCLVCFSLPFISLPLPQLSLYPSLYRHVLYVYLRLSLPPSPSISLLSFNYF